MAIDLTEEVSTTAIQLPTVRDLQLSNVALRGSAEDSIGDTLCSIIARLFGNLQRLNLHIERVSVIPYVVLLREQYLFFLSSGKMTLYHKVDKHKDSKTE